MFQCSVVGYIQSTLTMHNTSTHLHTSRIPSVVTAARHNTLRSLHLEVKAEIVRQGSRQGGRRRRHQAVLAAAPHAPEPEAALVDFVKGLVECMFPRGHCSGVQVRGSYPVKAAAPQTATLQSRATPPWAGAIKHMSL